MKSATRDVPRCSATHLFAGEPYACVLDAEHDGWHQGAPEWAIEGGNNVELRKFQVSQQEGWTLDDRRLLIRGVEALENISRRGR